MLVLPSIFARDVRLLFFNRYIRPSEFKVSYREQGLVRTTNSRIGWAGRVCADGVKKSNRQRRPGHDWDGWMAWKMLKSWLMFPNLLFFNFYNGDVTRTKQETSSCSIFSWARIKISMSFCSFSTGISKEGWLTLTENFVEHLTQRFNRNKLRCLMSMIFAHSFKIFSA